MTERVMVGVTAAVMLLGALVMQAMGPAKGTVRCAMTAGSGWVCR